MASRYTLNQFHLFRICLSSYILIHFIYLIPYASELFSNDGMFPADWSLTYGYFPNILNLVTSASGATLFLILLTGLSILFLIDFDKFHARRWVPLLLWFGWACLLNRNVLIRNPGMPYVGFLLLLVAALPTIKDPKTWRLPKDYLFAAWAVMALGYTLSGIDKMMSPSWQDGTAIFHLLNNPLARDTWLREKILQYPALLQGFTYFTLFLEVAFLPLALIRKTRPFIWMGMLAMQFGVLVMVDFADLTFGMLMIHLFTFDSRWLKPTAFGVENPIVFFDGVCGLCNRSVDFVMAEDQDTNFRFATLQGIKAEEILKDEKMETFDTLYLYADGKVYNKSEAWFKIIAGLGGVWSLAGIFRIIPRAVNDLVYDLIAKYRYAVFEKRETCRLPNPDERALFLA